jgi:hypothetical protein
VRANAYSASTFPWVSVLIHDDFLALSILRGVHASHMFVIQIVLEVDGWGPLHVVLLVNSKHSNISGAF